MLKSVCHSLEYVCLSRIKLVLRLIKEIFHAVIQWTVFHTEMNNNRCTEANRLMGRESSICYLLFHYIWIVIIIAISLISVLDLFYGDVEFLLSFNAELCKVCKNTLSYVFFLV